MKKKIGTIMEERLLYEAKKAALEKGIPFHRFVEQAVEKHVRESNGESEKINRSPAAGISEKSPPYRFEGGISSPAVVKNGDSAGGAGVIVSTGDFDRTPSAAASFSIPPEERWKRALQTAGKYHSGRGDISARHDDFAVNAFKE